MITREEFEKSRSTIFSEKPEEKEFYKRALNKEELEQLYVKGREKVKSIAKRYDHTKEYIRQKLSDCGIPLRKIDTVWRKEYLDGVIIHINGQSYSEHRYVWQQANGPIPKGWLVHHLNGIKTDNRLENLIAIPREKHGIDQLFPAYEKRVKNLEYEVKQLNELVQSYEDFIAKMPNTGKLENVNIHI